MDLRDHFSCTGRRNILGSEISKGPPEATKSKKHYDRYKMVLGYEFTQPRAFFMWILL